MKLIERKQYLNDIIDSMGTPDIKVITGVRRSGKSKLLEAFKEYILEHQPHANIIHINFNLMDYEQLLDYHKLYIYINTFYDAEKDNYVLIDEIQMCQGFEKVINSLHASEKFDIYITGSNAFLLSSDLATLFTGRTYEIKIFPFSFKEYCIYYEPHDFNIAFDQYLLEGGLAGSYLYHNEKAKFNYIADIFDTLVLRDIKQKYRIKSSKILDNIAGFLMDNIANLASGRSITNALLAKQEKISGNTVRNYIQYLCNAFAFYKISRYDIRGKKYLSTSEKYYLSDHSFRYAKLGTKNMDYGRVIENIVAIELLRRGYEVYVGVLYKKEIDFVAIKRNEKMYIQVSDSISDEKTFRREVEPLLAIKDAYPKIIIARTRQETYYYEGVQIVNVATWLCDE